MSITSFTYRRNLNLVHKDSLFRIAAFLGVPVGRSANKPTMIGEIRILTITIPCFSLMSQGDWRLS